MAKAQVQKSKQESKEATGAVAKQTHDEEVREQLKEIVTQVEESYIDLARLLAETYHKEFYLAWGFDTFEKYCEEELDFQYRKAMYFVEIWDKTKSLNIPKSKLTKLGWTKLKDLVTVMDEENAKEWIEKASDMTTREVTDAVKITKRADPTANAVVPSITTMTLRMGESEANIILEAIEEAKRICESDNAIVALEMICQDWMVEKGVGSQRRSIHDHVRYLEQTYGVSINVGSKKSSKKKEVEDEDDGTITEPVKKKAEKTKTKKSDSIDDLIEKEEEKPAPKGKKRPAVSDINALIGLD